MKNQISINCHSSIKIVGEKTIYVDPYCIEEETHDADLIFITHDHYDHFEPESIKKLLKDETLVVIPNRMLKKVIEANLDREKFLGVNPDEDYCFQGTNVKTVSSYNIRKEFHPKSNYWVGYIIEQDNEKIYVSGDSDATEEMKKVECDIALLPIGGKYTMNIKEAAEVVNNMKPKHVIPTHYGKIVGEVADGQKFQELINEGIECHLLIK